MLAMLMVQAADLAPIPEVAQEVVVIGRRLKDWGADFRSKGDTTTCKVRQSTGDAEIDAIGCAAMTECWPAARPSFDASQAKGLAKAERKRRLTASEQLFGACVFDRRTEKIVALAEVRAKARGL